MVVLICEVHGREGNLTCLVACLVLLLFHFLEVRRKLIDLAFSEVAARIGIIDHESVELFVPGDYQDIKVAHLVQLNGFFK